MTVKPSNSKWRPLGCAGRLVRVLGIVILVLVILFAALALYQRVALARFMAETAAPGQRVKVENHLMHLNCVGSGAPTVVIDAGNGSFSVEWMPVQAQLSQTMRVCVYDRSGYGWSEPGPQPRNGLQAASELHQLLQAAGESGPYILVGHSLGGVYARVFAVQYPTETAGMVLVETAYPLQVSPEFEVQMRSSIGFYQVMGLLVNTGVMRILGPLSGEDAAPESARSLPPELKALYLNLLLSPDQYTTAIAEMEALPETFRQAEQSLPPGEHPFGDLPLIVLTAGQMAGPGSTPFGGERIPVPAQQIEAQAQLAGLSTRGEQRVAPESGHLMHIDAPAEIIRAVEDMMKEFRGNSLR